MYPAGGSVYHAPSPLWALPDRMNTTIDESYSVNDVYSGGGNPAAVSYERNLQLMQANAQNEVRELQRRARERVAYDVDSFMVSPLMPKWDRVRADACIGRALERQTMSKAGVDGYTSIPGVTAVALTQPSPCNQNDSFANPIGKYTVLNNFNNDNYTPLQSNASRACNLLEQYKPAHGIMQLGDRQRQVQNEAQAKQWMARQAMLKKKKM